MREIDNNNQIQLPSIPWSKLGNISRGTVAKSGHDRSYRGGYDWTVFNEKQLPTVEGVWDRWTDIYQELLPDRFQKPKGVCGINLGTFNGCFQKAWIRKGYKMYGIEAVDVIDELHKYGCEGEQASFFKLDTIPDNTYDFAILDRCVCGPEFYKSYDKAVIDDSIEICDILGNKIMIPPYFNEIFRILKPGGSLLAILYESWSERILKELCSHGITNFITVKKAQHPWLAVCVDTQGQSTELETLQNTLNRCCSSGDMESVVNRLRASGNVWHKIKKINNRIIFLYIPTNHIVELSFESGGLQIIDNSFWSESLWSDLLFEDEIDLISVNRNSRAESSPLLVLVDDPLIHLKRAASGFKKIGLNDVAVSSKKMRGLKQLNSQIKPLIENLHPRGFVLAVGAGDARIKIRNGRPRLDSVQIDQELQKLSATLLKTGLPVLIVGSTIPLSGEDCSIQQQPLQELNGALEKWAISNGFQYVPTQAAKCNYLSIGSKRLSSSGIKAWCKNIANAISLVGV